VGPVLRALANWWDAVELWLTQLPFPVQVLLAAVVLPPSCWAVAVLMDRVVDLAAASWSRHRWSFSPARAAARVSDEATGSTPAAPAGVEQPPAVVPSGPAGEPVVPAGSSGGRDHQSGGQGRQGR